MSVRIGKTYIKDSNSTLDYENLWADWLDGDTITASVWIVDTGITKASDTHTTTTTTIWLTGGTVGTGYNITNRITTAAGRIDDRTSRVIVKDR